MITVNVAADVDLHDFVDALEDEQIDECMGLLRERVTDGPVAGKALRDALREIRDAAAVGDTQRAADLAVQLATEYLGVVDLRPAVGAPMRRAA